MSNTTTRVLQGIGLVLVAVCFGMAVMEGRGDSGLHREFLATFPEDPLFQNFGEQQWQSLKATAQKEGIPFEKLIRDAMVITRRVKAEHEARVRQNRTPDALRQEAP